MSLCVFIVSIVAWCCDAQWASSYLRPCWVLLALSIVVYLLEK